MALAALAALVVLAALAAQKVLVALATLVFVVALAAQTVLVALAAVALWWLGPLWLRLYSPLCLCGSGRPDLFGCSGCFCRSADLGLWRLWLLWPL